MNDDYITLKEASENWCINQRRLQLLCSEGKIENCKKIAGVWFIPSSSKRPSDKRVKSGKYIENIWTEENISKLNDYIILKTQKIGMRRSFRRGMMELDTFDIEEFIKVNLDKSFSQNLFNFIDERQLDDVYVYKKAGVDRRVFSKIKTDDNYQPSFETCIRFCLALKLNVENANCLLKTAGYYLSTSKKRDLVIMYCLDNGIDDYKEVVRAIDILNTKGE